MFSRLRQYLRRKKYRRGARLSRFLAPDIRRDVDIIDDSEVGEGFVRARIRTWNVRHAVRRRRERLRHHGSEPLGLRGLPGHHICRHRALTGLPHPTPQHVEIPRQPNLRCGARQPTETVRLTRMADIHGAIRVFAHTAHRARFDGSAPPARLDSTATRRRRRRRDPPRQLGPRALAVL